MAIEAAILNAGVDAMTALMGWGAIHSDATSASQTSNQRIALTWGAAAAGVATVTNVPLAFTGTGGADASHFGAWNQDQPGGTFRGAAALVGDQAFNASGDYNVTSATLTASDTTTD
jgi:hypothetical protein